MAELGFVRNEGARQLRAGVSRALAYVMLDGRNPFFTDVAQGIEDAASRRRAQPLHLQQRRQREPRARPPRAPRAAAGAGHPDHPARPGGRLPRRHRPARHPGRDRRPHARDLTSSAPSRSTTSSAAGSPSSTSLELGHETRRVRRRPDVDRPGARPARTAPGARWADAGRDPDALVHLVDVGADRGRGPRRRRAARRAPPPTPPDRGVLRQRPARALGLLQQTIGAGGEVPGDLAIVGYDDIEFAAAAAVPLSSVRQPRQELGSRAAELVLDEAVEPRPHAPAGGLPPRARRAGLQPRRPIVASDIRVKSVGGAP